MSPEERIAVLETEVKNLNKAIDRQAIEYERRLTELKTTHRLVALLSAVTGGIVTGLIVKLAM